ncbi:NAD(P)/FAD-dependent oxidoreductase [Leisingera sp. ANG-M7]|uniref:NAD(P)/FAD-dependent oxidoreductase n=1 Tax=Leisingera sp. ANG-M7 TaxID=1577902 RepID=UPI00057D2D9F|nr:FAD-binding oxidoreductase [Leisingera sp. ANG-M7]KIC36510.1 FAD-binding oxidoreductase [Leisingera sp. ANG-M7]
MSETKKTVAIIGAGIVGVSAAIELQRDGHQVILIDGKGPGEGTSHGNGGILASCSIVPVTGPGLWKKAPKMLLDANQPLFMRWGYLPKLAPWLMKYMSHANAADTARIAAALAPIVGDSLADHQALAAGTGAERHLRPSDYLFLYNDRAHFGEDAFGWGLRRKHGFRWGELEGADFRAYDSIYSEDITFAARLKDHGIITDPGQYVKDLAAHVTTNGGRLIQAFVTDVARENRKVTGVRAGGETFPCDAVVVATGVWSKPLAEKLGISVPLEAERGYHLELWEPSAMPKAPVMVAAAKCVVTPMEGRIRIAGIVEFGGLEAGPSKGPLELLHRNARRILPGVTWKREVEWQGARPAPADSIPLIGEVPGLSGAYVGFGHHHIGLTGGPKTGRLLAQMISGRTPNMDMSAYAPARYAI